MSESPWKTLELTPARSMEVQFAPVSAYWRLKCWRPFDARRPVTIGSHPLPGDVGATLEDSPRVLCIGPGEWLLVSNEPDTSFRPEPFEPAFREQGVVVVCLTHGLVTLEARGREARDLLATGCGVDLHLSRFPVGRCARTRFAQIPVIIECLAAEDQFALHVDRSRAQYLHDWVTDAALEFEVPLSRGL
jgi:sarcosine oxidase, subunit gamma